MILKKGFFYAFAIVCAVLGVIMLLFPVLGALAAPALFWMALSLAGVGAIVDGLELIYNSLKPTEFLGSSKPVHLASDEYILDKIVREEKSKVHQKAGGSQSSGNLTTCKYCKAEFDSVRKTCPECGAPR